MRRRTWAPDVLSHATVARTLLRQACVYASTSHAVVAMGYVSVICAMKRFGFFE